MEYQRKGYLAARISGTNTGKSFSVQSAMSPKTRKCDEPIGAKVDAYVIVPCSSNLYQLLDRLYENHHLAGPFLPQRYDICS